MGMGFFWWGRDLGNLKWMVFLLVFLFSLEW